MKEIRFIPVAWDEYVSWQHDSKTIKRINGLLKDIQRGGTSDGIGKPEPLRHRKAWSRRIDHANRLVYNIDENQDIIVLSCKGHYED